MDERAKLEQAIASLEAQRLVLGDAVVEASIAALREKIQTLQPSSVQELRKQVTVLFADIAEFTRLSEAADAEDVTEFTNSVWQIIDRIILEYGGKIDKHIGDAVMALWGSESAQEDDGARAVHAAMEIQRRISSQELVTSQANGKPAAASFVKRLPTNLLRIGIHTGPVFLGTVGTTGEFTAMGDTVNTASRIQHLTQPGQIAISHVTYLQVRGLFSVELLEPTTLRGKTEPLQVYLVKHAKPRLFRPTTRGVEGIETSMVGRDADLQRLQFFMLDSIQSKTCRLVTIIGDAGLGKSRLIYEFENWAKLLPDVTRHFRGRASQEIQNRPYALLRDVFLNFLSIQENEPPADVRAKFEQGIEEWLGKSEESQMKAHVIGQLLGFDFRDSPHLAGFSDRQQLRSRALFYLSEYFHAITAVHPVVLFLDDIHWADMSTLEAVEILAAALAQCALLILCIARPTFFERRPQWAGSLPQVERLDLKPLSTAESRELISQLLRKADNIPEALYEIVISESEGNPYYVEEFIKMLMDDRVIVVSTSPWKIEMDRLNRLHIPANLTGVIQSRLDSLSAVERRVIQQASVVGRVFWDDAIKHLSEDIAAVKADNRLSETLESLHQREFIFELRNSTFQGAREYIFKHALLRQVTYESVLKRERSKYHAQIAAWLVQRSGERISEFASLIGTHLDLAGSASEAAGYLRQAGEWAAQQFDNLHALAFFDRALELASPDRADERYAILCGRELVNDSLGRREAQFEDLHNMEKLLAEVSMEPNLRARLQAEIEVRFSNYFEVTSNYPQAIATARQAVEHANLSGDKKQQCASYYRLGRALWRQGDNIAGLSATQRALELAREADWKQVQAHSLRQIGAITFHLGDYVRVMPSYEEALVIYQSIGDRAGAGSTLNNMGDAQRQLGLYSQARQSFEQSIQTSRSIGERWSENVAVGNLAQICITLGEFENGLQFARQALENARIIDQRWMIAFNLFNIGRAQAGLGKLDEAVEAFQQSAVLRSEIGQQRMEAESRSWLAYLYLLQDNSLQAHRAVGEVLEFLENNSLDGVEEPFLDYLLCYRVLKANRDPRAAQLLNSAHTLLRQQAAQITDRRLRDSFLCNVKAHAEIIQEWEEAEKSSDGK